jgi:hypothetical protein
MICVSAFVEFFEAVIASVFISCKEGEEEGKLSLIEEQVLRSLTVKVHRVADDFVSHGRVQEERVGLGVAVAKEEHLKHV